MGMLESGIQVAQSKEEEDTKRFAKEIAEEVPKLNRALQATREALEKPKLADLGADVNTMVRSQRWRKSARQRESEERPVQVERGEEKQGSTRVCETCMCLHTISCLFCI